MASQRRGQEPPALARDLPASSPALQCRQHLSPLSHTHGMPQLQMPDAQQLPRQAIFNVWIRTPDEAHSPTPRTRAMSNTARQRARQGEGSGQGLRSQIKSRSPWPGQGIRGPPMHIVLVPSKTEPVALRAQQHSAARLGTLAVPLVCHRTFFGPAARTDAEHDYERPCRAVHARDLAPVTKASGPRGDLPQLIEHCHWRRSAGRRLHPPRASRIPETCTRTVFIQTPATHSPQLPPKRRSCRATTACRQPPARHYAPTYSMSLQRDHIKFSHPPGLCWA